VKKTMAITATTSVEYHFVGWRSSEDISMRVRRRDQVPGHTQFTLGAPSWKC
jgi:hypothetical protein